MIRRVEKKWEREKERQPRNARNKEEKEKKKKRGVLHPSGKKGFIINLNCFLNILWKVPKIKNKGLLNFHIDC